MVRREDRKEVQVVAAQERRELSARTRRSGTRAHRAEAPPRGQGQAAAWLAAAGIRKDRERHRLQSARWEGVARPPLRRGVPDQGPGQGQG